MDNQIPPDEQLLKLFYLVDDSPEKTTVAERLRIAWEYVAGIEREKFALERSKNG